MGASAVEQQAEQQVETFLDTSSAMTLVEGPVTISDAAARRVGEILAKTSDKKALRVSVEGGGCSGFSYKFDLTDAEPNADGQVLTSGDAVVYVDPVSGMYMGGSELDFVENFLGRSFQVTNPNATANCGCGTSFSI